MRMPHLRIRWLAAMMVLVIAVFLSACSDDSAPTIAPTPTPDPTSTPAPADSPTPTTAPSSATTPAPTYTPMPAPTSTSAPTPATAAHASPGAFDLNADSIWQEVFDALGASEQSCIRNALGDDLKPLLAKPVLSDEEDDRMGPFFSCVDPENARAVFIFVFTWSLEEELELEFDDQQAACVRELVAGIDVAAVLAGSEDPAEDAAFVLGMISCFPYQLGSATDEPETFEPVADAPLSASEVYARVAPSVAFIETPSGTGSGVLIEGGFIVTNRHVVWPYESVWATFPDGTWFDDVPVIGWDALSDLAVLGPVDISAARAELVDGEHLAPGSELYLVGYPAETEDYPEPTISRGILSRFREWDWFGMTYLQTDASIAGGQSGGALVNDRGQVVGISTYSFGGAEFGLATSMTDDIAIIEDLILWGWDSADPSRRRLPTGEGKFAHTVTIPNEWTAITFVLDGEAGLVLQVQLEGPGDGAFAVVGPGGLIYEADEGLTGAEFAELELQVDGPHFITVSMFSEGPQEFDLASNVLLRYFPDPDDEETIQVWEALTGNVDQPRDYDSFWLRLEEGESVVIFAESVSIDTFVVAGLTGLPETIAHDDDGAGGTFGTDSALFYRALQAGSYFILVSDATGASVGGYLLEVAAIDALEIWDDNGDGKITCAEATANNIAPVSFTHPAYEYMDDEDGDGVVCG